MPSYVIRVDRKEPPFYVMWSTISDDVTAAGTREQLQQMRRSFTHHGGRLANRYEEVGDERFDRADETGTSDMYEDESLRTGTWDDTGFVCQQMWLPRHRLRSYAENLLAGGDGRWLLEVIGDDGNPIPTVTNDDELDEAVRKATGLG